MNKQKSIKEILQQTKGASLIYVLCIMLFLLSISGSVLVAASTSAGSAAAYKAQEQMQIYAQDSYQVLSQQLTKKPLYGQELTSPKAVGQAILWDLYQHPDGKDLQTTIPLSDMPTPNTNLAITDNSINLSFSQINVEIIPGQYYIAPTYGTDGEGNSIMIDPGQPEIPEKTYINFTLTTSLNLSQSGENLTATGVYVYANGYLEKRMDHSLPDAKPVFINPGEWRQDSYEITKS